MAYCVRCGVKLEEGAMQCPLCFTAVIASDEVIGTPSRPLFPQPQQEERYNQQRFDKQRKGFIELLLALTTIAVITLAITGWALKGTSFSPLFAIIYVIIGAAMVLLPLILKPSYRLYTSLYTFLVALLLSAVAWQFNSFIWFFITASSLLIFWLWTTWPLFIAAKYRLWSLLLPIGGTAGYLYLLDRLSSGASWFLAVALPLYVIVLVGVATIFLVYRRQRSISESVLVTILVACFAVGSGDFFALRFVASSQLISWSLSLWIVGGCLLLYLVARATFTRVKLYFSTKID